MMVREKDKPYTNKNVLKMKTDRKIGNNSMKLIRPLEI